MVNDHQQTMNPWFAIWTQPRATIKYLLATDAKAWVLIIAACFGIYSIFDSTIREYAGPNELDTSLTTLTTAAFLLGPFFGFIYLYLQSGMLLIVGKWLGGQANYTAIKAVVAWSSVPTVLMLVITVFRLALFGPESFAPLESANETPAANMTIMLDHAFWVIVETLLTIWGLFIFLTAFAEVQQFSLWKSFFTLVLEILLLVAIVIASLALVESLSVI